MKSPGQFLLCTAPDGAVKVLLPVCGLVAGGATVRGALNTVRMIEGKA